MDDKIKLKDRMYTMGWAFKQAWRMDKKILVIWSFLSVAFSVLPAVVLGLNRNVIAIITNFITGSAGDFSDVIGPIIALGIVLIAVNIANRFNADFFGEVMYDSYCLGMQELMMDSVQKVPPKKFLDKDFNDEYTFIGSRYFSLVQFISSCCEILGKVFGLISLLIVAFTISPLIFGVSIVYIIMASILSGVISRPTAAQWVKVRDFYRVAEYYGDMALSPTMAKEIRVYEAEENVINRYEEASKITEKHENKNSFSREFGVLLVGIWFYVFLAGMIIYSLVQVKNGQMGVDVFLMLYALCTSLFGMTEVMNRCIARLSFFLFGLTKIRHFVKTADTFEQKSEGTDTPLEGQTVFECKNLSFAYDDKKQVLRGINFKIKKGDVVALVGLNGSGKTTLTQLLLGLYQPNKGEVLLYGRPISQYSQKFLTNHIGVFFQSINLFHLSMRENVGFGDVREVENDDKVMEAIKKGGAEKLLSRMKEGLNALLNRDVDKTGYILSGGEQQKVAVSRAHMSDKDILIFDEPASMLDPIAEMEQFMNIKQKLQGRTAILISHRVGFAKLANRIFVLKDGELIETGTHEELMAKNGEYADFFSQQAEWYKTDKQEA